MKMNAKPEMCHCGKPLHYIDPNAEAYVRSMVKRFGPTLQVTVGDTTYLVPRHYLALHGLKAAEIETLGFARQPKKR